MRFLIDMSLSPDWANVLTDAGFESVHWSSVGTARASDSIIADFARNEGMVVITNDLDFGKLLSADRAQLPSVIQVRLGDLRPQTLMAALLQTIEIAGTDLEKGAPVTIGTSKIRITALPLSGDAP